MKTFIKKVLHHVGVLFVAYVIFFALLLVLFLGFGMIFKGREFSVEEGSALVFNLSVNITDSPRAASPLQYLEDSVEGLPSPEVHLKAVTEAINRAAKDDRISVLFLHGSLKPANFGSNYPNLGEIREAIEGFRKGGKPVIAYLVNPTKRDYYLASAADTVVLHPFGFLSFNGMAANLMFFGQALEKYGIEVQSLKVGKFKSAGEIFTRDGMSPENREQTSVWLEGLWNSLLEDIAKSRGLEGEALRKLADEKGLFSAEEARAFGFVDQVSYFDELLEDLKKLTHPDAEGKNFAQVSLARYIEGGESSLGGFPFDGKPKLAVIYAEGEIVDGEGDLDQVGGDRMARELRKLRLDKEVKAVVLRVNSPGGSATASEVIEREVRLLSKEKPVVVSMGGYAASGGYWISAHAQRILAEDSTITGSIGVFGLLPNIRKLANEHGITFDGVKTSPFADIFTLSRSKTPQELALIRQFIDFIYDNFLQRVGEGRNLSRDKVEEIAQGRVWTGADAQKIGLVDMIGGLDAAIESAAELGGLGEDWTLIQVPEKPGLAEMIEELVSGGNGKPLSFYKKSITRHLGIPWNAFPILNPFNDPRGVYARLPFFLNLE